MAKVQSTNSYFAVSVNPNESEACEAAKNMSGKRFLRDDVPVLPLEACDRHGQCQRKYEKWDDRRQDERRFVVAGMVNPYQAGDEKRSLRGGRRSTD